MSHVNENQIIVPKQFTRFNDDDDDSQDDVLINKRASIYNSGGYSHLKKRKQMAKPPMEVMNEIVNSIYLKRWEIFEGKQIKKRENKFIFQTFIDFDSTP